MEKYLVPEGVPVGEGELSEQWKRFKHESLCL